MAIIIPIDADVSGLTRKLNGATSILGTFGRTAAIVAGAAAFGGLVATVKIGIDEFVQAEKVTAQTNAVLKSTGGVANVTARQIDQLGTSIMRKSGFDDEAVKSAENLLLTFTNVRNEAGKGNDVFSQATQITADLSVAFGKDLNQSAILVGKALNDPIKGLGALSRVGIQFSEDQKKTIKALVESGDTMKAQKMILKELETQVGGSAAAYGETLSGKLNIAKETFRNLAADLVSSFLPTLAVAATKLVEFVRQIASAPTLRAKVDVVVGAIKDAVGQSFSSFLDWWLNGKQSITRGKNNELTVILVPSGKAQFEAFFHGLELSAANAGRSVGNAFADAIAGGFSSKGKGKITDAINRVFDVVGQAAEVISSGQILAVNFILGITDTLSNRLGTAIHDALISAFHDAIGVIPGPLKSVAQDAFNQAFGPRTRLLSVPTVAKIITSDMKAAIQSARQSLAGAASSLGGLLGQITSANLSREGVFKNSAQMLQDQRDLEDRGFAIKEQSLKDALAATQEGSAEQTQAKLDLDQFYYDKSATLRQRAVDDESAKNQSQIDNLAARFNKGIIDATTFNSELDKLIGGEAGMSLGESFSLGFTNALQSLKNAALDISGIAGLSNPLGPDVGATGGPVASAALQAYNDALGKWQDRQNTLAQKVKDLRDKANNDNSPGGKTITDAEQAAIDKAVKARDAHQGSKPNKKDYGLALGGILTGPRVIAGEAGNEAVIPLGSPTAADMMRKAFSEAVNGSGDTVYNISITAGMGADGNDIGRQIVEAIKVFERRNGPVFAGA